jgi:hypothetical protein
MKLTWKPTIFFNRDIRLIKDSIYRSSSKMCLADINRKLAEILKPGKSIFDVKMAIKRLERENVTFIM